MPPVAAPADKRFRRAHVKPAGSRAGRTKRVVGVVRTLVVLAIVVYGGWRGAALVAGAKALQVSNIVVRGHERLSPDDVKALVDGLIGQNIVGVMLDKWRTAVLKSPWVEEATLRRVLPSTIDITVRERQPIGIGRLGSGLFLVDAHGVVVDTYGPAYRDIDLPIVDGLAPPKKKGALVVDKARAMLAARLIAAIHTRPDLASRISQIDVSDPHDAVVMLDGDTTLLRIGEEEFVERLQQYLDLGDALRTRVADIDYVDLRFDRRLYVRPMRGSGGRR